MSVARLNECFREGIAAREARKEPEDNPYHFATPEHENWSEGWWHANEELMRPRTSGPAESI